MYHSNGVLSGRGKVCIKMSLGYRSLHRLSLPRTFVFPKECPRTSRKYIGNPSDHHDPSSQNSYHGKLVNEKEWTGKVATIVAERLTKSSFRD